MTRAERIEQKLKDAFAPDALEVVDESHLHAGHQGARPEGETHYRIQIVAATFAGQSRLQRQRQIYGVLADELAAGLHALAMTVLAPGEEAP